MKTLEKIDYKKIKNELSLQDVLKVTTIMTDDMIKILDEFSVDRTGKHFPFHLVTKRFKIKSLLLGISRVLADVGDYDKDAINNGIADMFDHRMDIVPIKFEEYYEDEFDMLFATING